MTVDLNVIIGGLYALVAVMLVVVLYNVLFILWDLRKIARRFEDLTSQVEEVILKPLAIADQGVQWLLEWIERKKKNHKHKHAHVVEENETEEASND